MADIDENGETTTQHAARIRQEVLDMLAEYGPLASSALRVRIPLSRTVRDPIKFWDNLLHRMRSADQIFLRNDLNHLPDPPKRTPKPLPPIENLDMSKTEERERELALAALAPSFLTDDTADEDDVDDDTTDNTVELIQTKLLEREERNEINQRLGTPHAQPADLLSFNLQVTLTPEQIKAMPQKDFMAIMSAIYDVIKFSQ
jgi:hypothetical protein